jgi:hypothetical protein
MIHHELIICQLVFPKSMSVLQDAILLVVADWHPDIPDSALPPPGDLIQDCLATECRNRRSFVDVLRSLKRPWFKLMPGVNSVKVAECVKTIKNRGSM